MGNAVWWRKCPGTTQRYKAVNAGGEVRSERMRVQQEPKGRYVCGGVVAGGVYGINNRQVWYGHTAGK